MQPNTKPKQKYVMKTQTDKHSDLGTASVVSDSPNITTRQATDPLNTLQVPIVATGNGSPLPVGWTVTEYPSTFDIHDHNGRFVTCFPKPYIPTPLGELIKIALVGKVRWIGGRRTASEARACNNEKRVSEFDACDKAYDAISRSLTSKHEGI